MRVSDLISRIVSVMRGEQGAYRRAMNTKDGKRVFSSIRTFCEVDRTPIVPGDDISTGVLIGKQEVWKMIRKNLGPDFEEEQLRRMASAQVKDLVHEAQNISEGVDR